METFTLWHHSFDVPASEFRFYATAVNVQRIGSGTDEMVEKMLEDTGLGDVRVDGWSLSHFATDYLSDDREGAIWEDVWMDTCEMRVHTQGKVDFRPPPPGLVETFAWDDTWSGGTIAPDVCSVIADFKSAGSLQTLAEVLEILRAERGTDEAEAKHYLSPPLAERLWTEARGRELEVVTCHEANQVHISMPSNDEFFETGAGLAVAIRELCEALGGTTQWRARFG